MKKLSYGPRAGMTVVELMIGLTVAAVLAMSATLAASESYLAFKSARSTTSVETNVRQAMDRVLREIISTGFGVMTPATLDDQFGSSDIVFQDAVDLNGDQVVWGNAKRLAFEYDEGEIDDGVDNNGDGLIDEGVLVLTLNDGMANEQRVILCHNVAEFLDGEFEGGGDDNGNQITDEAGFNVHKDGDVLTVRLTLQEPNDQGDPIARTLETAIRLRN